MKKVLILLTAACLSGMPAMADDWEDVDRKAAEAAKKAEKRAFERERQRQKDAAKLERERIKHAGELQRDAEEYADKLQREANKHGVEWAEDEVVEVVEEREIVCCD